MANLISKFGLTVLRVTELTAVFNSLLNMQREHQLIGSVLLLGGLDCFTVDTIRFYFVLFLFYSR